MPDMVQQIPIEEEYKKHSDITREDIARFRQWLETQPHLPGNYITDLDLLLVYHRCERSMGVSKQVLDRHLTLRTMFDVFFKNRVYDKTVETCLNTVLIAPLATPTVNGYRNFYLTLLHKDPSKLIMNDFFKTMMMIFDLWQYEEGTWPGLVITINMENLVLGHLTKVEVMTAKKILYFVQECMMTKLKEVHYMNAPPFVDKVMMIMKPFLNKDIMSMIHIHPVGTNSAYQYISKESLPKEDGGSYLSHEAIKAIIKRLRSNTEFFLNENLKRVDESLRPGGAAAVHDEFGVQGSFKQLNID